MSGEVKRQDVKSSVEGVNQAPLREEGTWSCVDIELPPRNSQNVSDKTKTLPKPSQPTLLMSLLQVGNESSS